MQKPPLGDHTTKEYWEHRVRTAKNREDMIFVDGRRDAFWHRVRRQLGEWAAQDMRVIDVACGFGKFAGIFTPATYLGVDFSEEMLAIAAKEKPLYHFVAGDAKLFVPPSGVDVIFEVNSLKSLGMTVDDFIKHFSPYAKTSIACLEADRFVIEQVYRPAA